MATTESIKRPKDKDSQKNQSLEWQAFDYIPFEKPLLYKLGLVLIVLAVSGVFLFSKQYLAVLAILAGGFALLTHADRPPLRRSFRLTEKSLEFEGRELLLGEMKSFWVTVGQEGANLYFEPKARLRSLSRFPLDREKALTVEEFLAPILPEAAGRGDDLAERVSRWLRF